ncbi:MAG: glycosyltransferase [halophilic archaeon J07HX5]|jgi:Glycosyltransferase|nr:MAG: glycosyltransferase [halophilic archaeon J07HX5]
MLVSHYFEWETHITGGHARSVSNQRTILERNNIAYTTSPTVNADLLHLNNMGPRSVLAARRARQADVPVLIHGHQTVADLRDSFRFFDTIAAVARPYLERAYSLGDRIIAPSAHTRDVLDSYTDVPKTVVSNGFDPTKLAGVDDPALRTEYRERYNLESPVVFMIGHVIERKGLQTFVETARAMPEVEFVWFGYLNPGGGTVDKLLRRRETTTLVQESPENCTFTGYVEDIRGAFAVGDVFFWPSHNENEGMALLEAMACGTASVIRDIPTYEWLTDGQHCLKADDNFLEPLRRLCADTDERNRIGENAATKATEFTLEAVADDLLGAYQSVTDEGVSVTPEN